MTQLDIFQSAQPRDATQAIKAVLQNSPDPMRELSILKLGITQQPGEQAQVFRARVLAAAEKETAA